MTKSPDDIICNCMQITRDEIIQAIKKEGADSVEKVGEHTEAGTVCGSCQDEIEEILLEL